MKYPGRSLYLIFLIILTALNSLAQEKIPRPLQEPPRVFIDCHQCDMAYIRSEITFVNFVRDRTEADVYILITIQSTADGGREYTLNFIGRNNYYDIHNTLKYVSARTDSPDVERKGLVRMLKVGLVPYLAKTDLGDYLKIDFEKRLPQAPLEDQWNFWVFSLGLSGSISGEQIKNFFSMNTNLSASRVTEKTKFRSGISGSFNSSRFKVEDKGVTDIISSTQRSYSLSTLYVFSLNQHWSVGGWFGLSSSTYNNISLNINPAPAIEYDYFPYSESTRRQLRFLYRVGYNLNFYQQETIYDKMREGLLGETLSVTLEIKEPWGNISSSLEGFHYFNDFKKNHFTFWTNLNLRVFRGLSVGFYGRFAKIKDQIYLAKGNLSLEDILLQRKALSTTYSYGLSIGISYTFGSIYAGVVNPRFGY
ncbi:MAG TPA: hypothetical protein ENO29_09135 [Candidatus Aminicenantes bacterium]|nr:MAG: hypothetical protein C0168_10455 [Candidatus Aminicenantes bacterium]HEK86498.1 hypothetical protein [Candidatus Aminicenantes bacterium]